MNARVTETLHDEAIGLDERPATEIAMLLLYGQVAAGEAVRQAVHEITEAAQAMARTIEAGGSLHYVAAGSSGLMAAADAQELGGTFSIPASQLHIHMAGGLPTGAVGRSWPAISSVQPMSTSGLRLDTACSSIRSSRDRPSSSTGKG